MASISHAQNQEVCEEENHGFYALGSCFQLFPVIPVDIHLVPLGTVNQAWS